MPAFCRDGSGGREAQIQTEDGSTERKNKVNYNLRDQKAWEPFKSSGKSEELPTQSNWTGPFLSQLLAHDHDEGAATLLLTRTSLSL